MPGTLGTAGTTDAGDIGGQHRAARGVSTLDGWTDEEWRADHRRRLAEFERERQRLVDALGEFAPDAAF